MFTKRSYLLDISHFDKSFPPDTLYKKHIIFMMGEIPFDWKFNRKFPCKPLSEMQNECKTKFYKTLSTDFEQSYHLLLYFLTCNNPKNDRLSLIELKTFYTMLFKIYQVWLCHQPLYTCLKAELF